MLRKCVNRNWRDVDARERVFEAVEVRPSLVEEFRETLQAPDGSFRLSFIGPDEDNHFPPRGFCSINGAFLWEGDGHEFWPYLFLAVDGKLDEISVSCNVDLFIQILVNCRNIFTVVVDFHNGLDRIRSLDLLVKRNLVCVLRICDSYCHSMVLDDVLKFFAAFAVTDTLREVDWSCLLYALEPERSSMPDCYLMHPSCLPRHHDLLPAFLAALERNLSIVEVHGGNGYEDDITYNPEVARLLLRNRDEVPKLNATVANQSTRLFDTECPSALAKRLLSDKFRLHSGFFDDRGDMCFCRHCHTRRGDSTSYLRGSPPSRYAVPIGFVRLGLSVNPGFAAANKIFDEWHVSYHGTTSTSIEPIFRGGLQLLMPGEVTLGGVSLGIRGGHIPRPFVRVNKHTGLEETFDPCQIFTSPSIRYSSHGAYASTFNVAHPTETGVRLGLRFVFQCRQRPGSYGVGQETVAAGSLVLDPLFSNNELEWYSKESPGIVLTGLLVRIEVM